MASPLPSAEPEGRNLFAGGDLQTRLSARHPSSGHYRLVMLDQRGAGAPASAGDVRFSTTQLLTGDIGRLRETLGIARELLRTIEALTDPARSPTRQIGLTGGLSGALALAVASAYPLCRHRVFEISDRPERQERTMIKVMWFLKRAEHLSLEEFRRWWLEEHAFDVAHHQSPHLRRYVVNVRTEDSGLPAAAPDGFDWDGVAEQWFDSVDAYKAAYSADPSPTRADTLAHTSRFARMVVTEQAYACEKRVER